VNIFSDDLEKGKKERNKLVKDFGEKSKNYEAQINKLQTDLMNALTDVKYQKDDKEKLQNEL
jgi:hypothetical protein